MASWHEHEPPPYLQGGTLRRPSWWPTILAITCLVLLGVLLAFILLAVRHTDQSAGWRWEEGHQIEVDG